MRTLQQPGAPLQPRQLLSWVPSAGELRVTLPGGVDLLNGLLAALDGEGIRDAAVTFLSGSFTRLDYLTGQPDDSGARGATYGPPNRLEGPVTLIGANAILGRDVEGRPLLHCHAVVADRVGVLHGGHLPPGAALLSDGGAVALVAILGEDGFRVAYDKETNYAIFQPAGAAPIGSGR